MLAPIVAGVAALYGWYRYKKSKEQAALDAALSTPAAPAAPPGFAPSKLSAVPPKTLSSIAKAVQQQTGLGAKLPTGTYGQGATTADVPSGRIPSSLYGAGGAPGPTPASSPSVSAGVSTGASFNFKL